MKIKQTHNWKTTLRKSGLSFVVLVLFVSALTPFAVFAAAPQDTYSWVKNIGTVGCPERMDPNSVAVANGKVYVTDNTNNSVDVFATDGTFLFKFGSYGSGNGQLVSPHGVAVAPSGNIYVADHGNNRIQVFSSTGTYVSQLSNNNTVGALGVAIDSSGNVYVASDGNLRIPGGQNNCYTSMSTLDGGGGDPGVAKFNTAGTFLQQLDSNQDAGVAVAANGNIVVIGAAPSFYDASSDKYYSAELLSSTGTLIKYFGDYGSSNGQLQSADGVALDSHGSVYISDSGNHRVTEFDATGTYVNQFARPESDLGGLAIDSSDTIYVTNHNKDRVEVFGSNTTYSHMFGDPSMLAKPADSILGSDGALYVSDSSFGNIKVYDVATGTVLRTIGSYGSGDGMLNNPKGVAFDGSGYLYVVDSGNSRIEKFDRSGGYLNQFGVQGSGDGQFDEPSAIAIDASDHIFIADSYNNRIQKFDANGTYLSQFGTTGNGNGQFDSPSDIALDTFGNIYVVDQNNYRIQKFNAQGSYLDQFGSQDTACDGSATSTFCYPTAIVVDWVGNVYVGDEDGYVKKFDPSGMYLSKFGGMGSDGGAAQSELGGYESGLALDAHGTIYVADTENSRISIWSAPILPSAPQNVSANPDSATTLRVSWQPPEHIGSEPLTGYRVQYRLKGTTTWTVATSPVLSPSTLSYTLIGLTANTAYDIQVVAINALGASTDIQAQVAQGIVTAIPGSLADTGENIWVIGSTGVVLLMGAGVVTWRAGGRSRRRMARSRV